MLSACVLQSGSWCLDAQTSHALDTSCCPAGGSQIPLSPLRGHRLPPLSTDPFGKPPASATSLPAQQRQQSADLVPESASLPATHGHSAPISVLDHPLSPTSSQGRSGRATSAPPGRDSPHAWSQQASGLINMSQSDTDTDELEVFDNEGVPGLRALHS